MPDKIKYPTSDLECIRYIVENCHDYCLDNNQHSKSQHLELNYQTNSTQFYDLRHFLSLQNVRAISESTSYKHTTVIYDISSQIAGWINTLNNAENSKGVPN
ncbi:hypothetical protein Cri9333_0647 [Crinalium epipsammum PCC 9333]|uniref:Uncharacterized protein n=1 Tax=Crinalium epipsammum PCC 9333 TaxID=1173022 RepID=K9VVL4_9CYAN|nr:hypothetical protein Cri9333_0647 [Crinalium epipsammum PCC 9333]